MMARKHTYLYVDDDAMNRQVMENLMLYVAERDITLFEDSRDFMKRVKALKPAPDIFFLDINLRPLDGYQLIKLLRADAKFKRSTIVAVTASQTTDEMTKLKKSGFDGALSKPLNAQTFAEAIERIEAGESVWELS
jgi:CheY-like chemotaxis protein